MTVQLWPEVKPVLQELESFVAWPLALLPVLHQLMGGWGQLLPQCWKVQEPYQKRCSLWHPQGTAYSLCTGIGVVIQPDCPSSLALSFSERNIICHDASPVIIESQEKDMFLSFLPLFLFFSSNSLKQAEYCRLFQMFYMRMLKLFSLYWNNFSCIS